MHADIIVIGAGVVGSALAFGLSRLGHKVLVFDGQDQDLRAARANFGLVWAQGKGAGDPKYQQLSAQSTDLWPDFHSELTEISATTIDYARPGGLVFCLSEEDFVAREKLIDRIAKVNGNKSPRPEMLSRHALEKLLPDITLGPDVCGASFGKTDGHVNPLQLLQALHKGIFTLGNTIRYRSPVSQIIPPKKDGGDFRVICPDGEHLAKNVIVAAGLQTPALTNSLGFEIPLSTTRGQILVTERLKPILPFPASGLRQTAEGTIMIGATQEHTDDRGVLVSSAATLAAKATRILPCLANAKLVRQWSGFRILPPDGSPIYAQSAEYSGLFAVACHSGVTLAATHAQLVGRAMIEGQLEKAFPHFSNGRFHV